jgi:hypothetical protein
MAAQSHGEIFGKVIDENNNPISGVVVRAENNGIVAGAATDERGIYRINGVEPGTYTVFYDLIGYSQLQVSDVQVKSDQIRKLSDFTLTTASYGTGGPVIIRAEKPLIDINGGTAISLGAKELSMHLKKTVKRGSTMDRSSGSSRSLRYMWGRYNGAGSQSRYSSKLLKVLYTLTTNDLKHLKGKLNHGPIW